MSTNSLCLSHIPAAEHRLAYHREIQAASKCHLNDLDSEATEHYARARLAAHRASSNGSHTDLIDYIERQL